MIRRPPRSTLDRSSAASDVYKRQDETTAIVAKAVEAKQKLGFDIVHIRRGSREGFKAVSYTHLRAHETVLDLVCRLLLEKKKSKLTNAKF